MNLDPLRAALQAEVKAEASRRRAEVDAACKGRLAMASEQARALSLQGKLDGEQAAAHDALRRRGGANRRARELRLSAQRALIDELRQRTREAALELRTDARYPDLLARLEQAAQSQLGPAAALEIDPPGLGGVRARSGSASVDYTLPALVDRAIEDLQGRVETLWT
jgi:vacuolar-type H+-ATPase subunit E/Vma4